LGERIGSVNTGLSEETIETQLKSKVYSTKDSGINLEEAASDDQETDSCIICQVRSLTTGFILPFYNFVLDVSHSNFLRQFFL